MELQERAPRGHMTTREREMAEIAAKEARHGFKSGQKIPDDFQNPPAGTRGHLCVDKEGRYRPDWFSLKMARTETMPRRQFFNCAGFKATVMVGVWADVPPSIIEALGYTEVNVIRLDMDDSTMSLQSSVPMVVDTIPRFNHVALESA